MTPYHKGLLTPFLHDSLTGFGAVRLWSCWRRCAPVHGFCSCCRCFHLSTLYTDGNRANQKALVRAGPSRSYNFSKDSTIGPGEFRLHLPNWRTSCHHVFSGSLMKTFLQLSGRRSPPNRCPFQPFSLTLTTSLCFI